MLRIEPALPMLRIEPVLPTLRIEPALPTLSSESTLSKLPKLSRLYALSPLRALERLRQLVSLATSQCIACGEPSNFDATDEFRLARLLQVTSSMEPIVLFGIQFTFSLVAYALAAWWYVAPRLARLPREVALVPLVWVHVFRIAGGTILAPGSVDAAVPVDFRTMIGFGDMATAVLALLALVALRFRPGAAIALVWLFLAVGTLDTVNAIIESMRYSVFAHGLGFNWVIVTSYVPALLVSSVLILLHLLRPGRSAGQLSG